MCTPCNSLGFEVRPSWSMLGRDSERNSHTH